MGVDCGGSEGGMDDHDVKGRRYTCSSTEVVKLVAKNIPRYWKQCNLDDRTVYG